LAIIHNILKTKADEIAALKTFPPTRIAVRRQSFLNALKSEPKRLRLIAEVKQASPSKGIIYTDFDPVRLAQTFVNRGATCLSVLTDKEYFKGHASFLTAIKETVDVPVLRKDFILDPLQIHETAAMGADAVLVILDLLSTAQANELIEAAREYELDVLVEVHADSAVNRLPDLVACPLVGINNRDLYSFEVDMAVTSRHVAAIRQAYPSVTLIAESGYTQPEELTTLANGGYNGVLIGEGLHRNPDLMNWFANEN
jgi:indole-3-glycerol phosphate synthase